MFYLATIRIDLEQFATNFWFSGFTTANDNEQEHEQLDLM